jgi:hypothetical protein
MLGSDRFLDSFERLEESRRKHERVTTLVTATAPKKREKAGVLGGGVGNALRSEPVLRRLVDIHMSCSGLDLLLKALDVFMHIFPRTIQNKIYEPAKEDLRQDLAEGRARFPRGGRRVLFHGFMVLRMVIFVAECMRVAVIRLLGKLIPPVLKAMWRMFS